MSDGTKTSQLSRGQGNDEKPATIELSGREVQVLRHLLNADLSTAFAHYIGDPYPAVARIRAKLEAARRRPGTEVARGPVESDNSYELQRLRDNLEVARVQCRRAEDELDKARAELVRVKDEQETMTRRLDRERDAFVAQRQDLEMAGQTIERMAAERSKTWEESDRIAAAGVDVLRKLVEVTNELDFARAKLASVRHLIHRDEIAAVRVECAETNHGYQPIETAPRIHGTPVLVGRADQHPALVEWHPNHGRWEFWEGGLPLHYEPTHWYRVSPVPEAGNGDNAANMASRKDLVQQIEVLEAENRSLAEKLEQCAPAEQRPLPVLEVALIDGDVNFAHRVAILKTRMTPGEARALVDALLMASFKCQDEWRRYMFKTGSARRMDAIKQRRGPQ